jgi:uncharacterized protein
VSPTPWVPESTPDSEPFWLGCRQGILQVQQCRSCGAMVWFPKAFCPTCGSRELHWTVLSGRGVIYSYSVVDRRVSDAFPDVYVLALIDLEEGPRFMSHVTEIDPSEVRIGMHVTVRFLALTELISLPIFVPDPDRETLSTSPVRSGI